MSDQDIIKRALREQFNILQDAITYDDNLRDSSAVQAMVEFARGCVVEITHTTLSHTAPMVPASTLHGKLVQVASAMDDTAPVLNAIIDEIEQAPAHELNPTVAVSDEAIQEALTSRKVQRGMGVAVTTLNVLRHLLTNLASATVERPAPADPLPEPLEPFDDQT